MCKGCGIIKTKAVKAYSLNPRSSMTIYEVKTRRRAPASKRVKLLHWSSWNPDWSPKQGRVGCGRQNLYRITAFKSK